MTYLIHVCYGAVAVYIHAFIVHVELAYIYELLAKATVSFLGRDKGLLESLLEEGKEIQRRKREKFLTVVQEGRHR